MTTTAMRDSTGTGRAWAPSLDHPAGRLAAALTSAALLYAASGLDPVWWAAWLAPIPILSAAFRASRLEAGLLALMVGLAGGASTTGYVAGFIGGIGAAALLVAQAAICSAVVLRTRAAVLGSRHWLMVFTYPTLCAACDLLMTTVGQGDTAGRVSYGQMDALPVIQIAAVAGTAGIAFTVSLFGALVAIAWRRRGDIDRPVLAYGLPLAALAAVLAFGALRLAAAPPAPSLRVGLAVIDHPVDRTPRFDGAEWTRYVDLVSRAARQGAQLVLLPEKSARLDAQGAAALQGALGRAAAASHIYVALAVDVVRGGRMENHAWLFGPDGALGADYVKHHLVPGFESRFSAGHGEVVATVDGRRIGLEICHDLDFPALSRAYADRGVSAVLVSASDFRIDERQHARAAMLRGVEDGFSIIRAAGWGLLSVSDRYGRVIAAESDVGAPVASLIAAAPLGPATPTPYARFGDVFGWLAAAASVALLLWPPIRRLAANTGSTPGSAR